MEDVVLGQVAHLVWAHGGGQDRDKALRLKDAIVLAVADGSGRHVGTSAGSRTRPSRNFKAARKRTLTEGRARFNADMGIIEPESDLDVRAFARWRGASFDQRPPRVSGPLRDPRHFVGSGKANAPSTDLRDAAL